MTERELMLDQDDVRLEDYELPECDECHAAAVTKVVLLDLHVGETLGVGAYCAECAALVAKRIRDELPPAPAAGTR